MSTNNIDTTNISDNTQDQSNIHNPVKTSSHSIRNKLSKYKLSEIVAQFEKDMSEKNNKPFKPLDFIPGDTIRIVEKMGNNRQAFEGVVIAIKSRSSRSRVTVRKVDIEKSVMIYCPETLSLDVIKRGVVRRAKLYYLRNLSGKKAKIKERITYKTR